MHTTLQPRSATCCITRGCGTPQMHLDLVTTRMILEPSQCPCSRQFSGPTCTAPTPYGCSSSVPIVALIIGQCEASSRLTPAAPGTASAAHKHLAQSASERRHARRARAISQQAASPASTERTDRPQVHTMQRLSSPQPLQRPVDGAWELQLNNLPVTTGSAVSPPMLAFSTTAAACPAEDAGPAFAYSGVPAQTCEA